MKILYINCICEFSRNNVTSVECTVILLENCFLSKNGYPGKLLYRKYGILIIPEENKAIMTLYNIAFKNQIGLSVPWD